MAGKPTSVATILPTSTLDTLKSSLLSKITTEGGYAYVSMATRAAEQNDFRAAEAGREMAWEQLHSGPWHSVLPIWRDAYAMSCLHVASFQYRSGEVKEALRVLDMGVIMGGSLLRKDLDNAIEFIMRSTRVSQEEDAGGTGTQLHDNRAGGLNEAEILKLLPHRSLSCKTIEKKSSPSLEGFLCDFFLSGTPVIIRDGMCHWPASKKWKDINYLKRIAGDRTVPVEVGKNYLCQDWKQELITFSQFIERIQINDPSGPTYLAQHPLFEQIQELRQDILVPDYCFVGGGELQSLNAWFGPSGTVTPLHHDPHHNIFAQDQTEPATYVSSANVIRGVHIINKSRFLHNVVGRKYIRLYHASISEDLYPYTETMLCNSSQVDLDHLDTEEFPKANDLDFMDCILEEGEMLYIPPKWWHYVRSLATSFSVSFWWSECSS